MALLETDPLDILLTADGDWAMGPDGLTFVSGIDGVAQLILIGLRLFQGEWMFDLDAGVPYFQSILGEKFSADVLHDEVTKVIVGTPGVVEILNLSITYDGTTRRSAVTASVRTEFGDTEIETEV